MIVFYTSISWCNMELEQVYSNLKDCSQYSVEFNNAVVLMVSTRPLISTSSRLSTNPVVTVPSTLTKIGITVTFKFHCCFFSSLEWSKYSSFFSSFFQFYSVVSWSDKEHSSTSSLFLFYYHFVWPRLFDPFVTQKPTEVCTTHFPLQILGCAYNIYSSGQISLFCTILRGSPLPPSRV